MYHILISVSNFYFTGNNSIFTGNHKDDIGNIPTLDFFLNSHFNIHMKITLQNLNTSTYHPLISMKTHGSFLNQTLEHQTLNMMMIESFIFHNHTEQYSNLHSLYKIHFKLKKFFLQILKKTRSIIKVIQIFNVEFLQFLNKKTWRLHPTFLNNYCHSSRISSKTPNMQGLPMDIQFQHCFYSTYTKAFVFGDYASFELRILAHLSRDDKFLKIFNTHLDPHNIIALSIFGSLKYREMAKEINYGIIYGISSNLLSRKLLIQHSDAKNFISLFFKEYPLISSFTNHSTSKSFLNCHSKTTLGHSLSINTNTKAAIAPIIRNAPLQGTAAEIIKIATTNLSYSLSKFHKSFLVNTIHDELIIECRLRDIEEIQFLTKATLEVAEKEILSTVVPSASVYTPHFHNHQII